MQNEHYTLTAHDVRRVAVAARCDPRTVVTYLGPRRSRMKSTTAARVRDALAELKIVPVPCDNGAGGAGAAT